MRIAILSDTHFPGRGSVLPVACLHVIDRADIVIHAGDLADLQTLTMLRGLGPPVVAVHGNADDDAVRRALPPTARVELPDLALCRQSSFDADPVRQGRVRPNTSPAIARGLTATVQVFLDTTAPERRRIVP